MDMCHRLIASWVCFLGILEACRGQQGTCHVGWVAYGNSCYLLNSHATYDWMESQGFCGIHRARLVTVETMEESKFIRHLVKTRITDPDDDTSVWLGATDDQTVGVWRWAGTDARLTFHDWAPGEPSTDPEDCLAMLSDYNYHWADLGCLEENYYICEKPNDTTSIIG